jgi:hypothetical protein
MVKESIGKNSPVLRIGIVGWGWMGQVHARAYTRLRQHYPDVPLRPSLVAVAEIPALVCDEATFVGQRQHGGVTLLARDRWSDGRSRERGLCRRLAAV